MRARVKVRQALLVSLLASAAPSVAPAEDSPAAPELVIGRASAPLVVDGDLSDPGWKDAIPIETWFETNPGDSVPPKVRSVARLAYDDRFFYAAFEFFDPDPSKIRAPLGDRDNVPSYTDYGGVILDTRHDGKTGLLLLANPRGIQYDAIQDDVTGNEDSSPDFYWESRAKIVESGWILEMRVPFSSLRYPPGDPQTWGILLYRNYPREFRYQMFSARLPRGKNCFICNENTLTGLSSLTSGGHFVVAPYTTASQLGHLEEEPDGRFENDPVKTDAGVDAKWTPNAETAIDAAANPDFSQVESDVAQISANERFALFYPEKRPFFLEGVELFSTPVQAVSTRTITSPRWGIRATGKIGRNGYTALVAEDRGGGSVVIPGATSSDLVPQEFRSLVFVGRVRHDLGSSFVSLLATDREVEGGGFNRVFGPDFQWRPNGTETITGQLLLSRTETPDRPELAAEWTGRRLDSHAGNLSWAHSTKTLDEFAYYSDYGNDFRADDGFVPQVGFREGYTETGYTFRPQGPITRLRTFAFFDRMEDRDGRLLFRQISPGCGMDGPRNMFARFRLNWDSVRSGERTLPRRQLVYTFQISPSRVFSRFELEGFAGHEVDFANSRPAEGGRATVRAALSPTNHLELRLNVDRRWLDVDAGRAGSGRLFTAEVYRLRAAYTFTARSYLRLIGQYVETRTDPALFLIPVRRRDAALSTSALFSYKLNWQSVMFVGYGDDRVLTDEDLWRRSARQFFLKLSYAFQG